MGEDLRKKFGEVKSLLRKPFIVGKGIRAPSKKELKSVVEDAFRLSKVRLMDDYRSEVLNIENSGKKRDEINRAKEKLEEKYSDKAKKIRSKILGKDLTIYALRIVGIDAFSTGGKVIEERITKQIERIREHSGNEIFSRGVRIQAEKEIINILGWKHRIFKLKRNRLVLRADKLIMDLMQDEKRD